LYYAAILLYDPINTTFLLLLTILVVQVEHLVGYASPYADNNHWLN